MLNEATGPFFDQWDCSALKTILWIGSNLISSIYSMRPITLLRLYSLQPLFHRRRSALLPSSRHCTLSTMIATQKLLSLARYTAKELMTSGAVVLLVRCST